jgi:hypothetical protein
LGAGKIQRFKDSRIQKFKDSKIQRFKAAANNSAVTRATPFRRLRGRTVVRAMAEPPFRQEREFSRNGRHTLM